MTREEAMKLANEMVSAWVANPPTNARGYADGWKPPTLGERTVSVVQLAEFLMVPEPQGKLVAPELGPPSPTVYGWAIDGSKGDPSYAQYGAAKTALASHEASGRPRPVDEIRALEALVGAYEATAPQAE